MDSMQAAQQVGAGVRAPNAMLNHRPINEALSRFGTIGRLQVNIRTHNSSFAFEVYI
jgi:hypothetical protein